MTYKQKNFDKNIAKYEQFACNCHQRRQSKSSLLGKNKIRLKKKSFFWKNQETYQKTQNFTLILNLLKKLEKNEHEKKQKKYDEHE
jgi:hypothetical protein